MAKAKNTWRSPRIFCLHVENEKRTFIASCSSRLYQAIVASSAMSSSSSSSSSVHSFEFGHHSDADLALYYSDPLTHVPISKLKRNIELAHERNDDRPLCVLLSTGALNPVHHGHVKMIEDAREGMEAVRRTP
jgi:hypothetical protein